MKANIKIKESYRSTYGKIKIKKLILRHYLVTMFFFGVVYDNLIYHFLKCFQKYFRINF